MKTHYLLIVVKLPSSGISRMHSEFEKFQSLDWPNSCEPPSLECLEEALPGPHWHFPERKIVCVTLKMGGPTHQGNP